MIDHTGFNVSNYEESKAFYLLALQPIGYELLRELEFDGLKVAGLGEGGKDNGKPGPRENYHPNYYGAFVIGPDGHNIEVVCHLPQLI